jgi:hypothetical protein
MLTMVMGMFIGSLMACSTVVMAVVMFILS